jgi:hypothetical protein
MTMPGFRLTKDPSTVITVTRREGYEVLDAWRSRNRCPYAQDRGFKSQHADFTGFFSNQTRSDANRGYGDQWVTIFFPTDFGGFNTLKSRVPRRGSSDSTESEEEPTW